MGPKSARAPRQSSLAKARVPPSPPSPPPRARAHTPTHAPPPNPSNPHHQQILGPVSAEHADILTPEAVQFLATLHRCFNPRRLALLAARQQRQQRLDQGELPDFLAHTAPIRADPSWRGAAPAPGLVDRRVEITGPVDRKMVINALNCGASTFMADFEDSSAPTWRNLLDGQVNLRDALDRTIAIEGGANGKSYRLKPASELATLLVRPRGWHMEEVR